MYQISKPNRYTNTHHLARFKVTTSRCLINKVNYLFFFSQIFGKQVYNCKVPVDKYSTNIWHGRKSIYRKQWILCYSLKEKFRQLISNWLPNGKRSTAIAVSTVRNGILHTNFLSLRIGLFCHVAVVAILGTDWQYL